MRKFTEGASESYYDSEDEVYRSFWDTEGSLHWGLFDESSGQDFLKACANLNEFMANKAGLLPESSLLDIGCGNGNTAMWLSSARECSVVGVDLSGVRINNAIQALEGAPAPLRDRVRFERLRPRPCHSRTAPSATYGVRPTSITSRTRRPLCERPTGRWPMAGYSSSMTLSSPSRT